MPNLAQQLKAEIGRIAKREIRAETQTYKKTVALQRAEVQALKRRIQTLEAALKRVGKTAAALPQAAPEAEAEAEAEKLRFRVDGFAKLRQKLGLSAADMARMLGVSAQSVYHWESGKTRPRPSQLKAIAAVRKLGKKEVAARLAASTQTQA